MKRVFWTTSVLLAAAFYVLLAGSSTFQGILGQWSQSITEGAVGGSFYLASVIGPLLAALWLFAVSGGLGWKIVGKWAPKLEAGLPKIAVSVLTGFAGIVYVFWFAGILQLFSKTALSVLCAALTLVAAFSWRALWAEYAKISIPVDGWVKAGLIAAGLFLVLQIPASHAPSLDRDDLSYHLYIPQSYLDFGGIHKPPFAQRQSFFHQMMNMSYIPALFLGGENAVKMLNVFWGMILAFLAYALAKRANASDSFAWIAAISVWMLPTRFHLAQTASTDLAATCFILGGLYCLLSWKDLEGSGLLFLSAFLSAFALNKYTSWAYFIATAVIFLWAARLDFRKILKGFTFYAILAPLCLTPLALYLWKSRGNPFYPLPFFGLPYDKVEEAFQKGWIESRNFVTLKAIFKGSLAYMGPLVPMGLAASTALRALPSTNAMLILWSLLPLLLKYATQGANGLLPRYILASLVALICVAVAAFSAFEDVRWQKPVRIFIFFSWILPCALTCAALSRPQLALNFGFLNEEEFQSRFYPSEGWEMNRRVNALPNGVRIAALDHHFTPLRYRDSAAHLALLSYEDMQQSDPQAIHSMLASRGITHVLWVRSQWNPEPVGRGVIMHGNLFGRYMLCRWWKSGELSFLKPAYETQGAVLFEVMP